MARRILKDSVRIRIPLRIVDSVTGTAAFDVIEVVIDEAAFNTALVDREPIQAPEQTADI